MTNSELAGIRDWYDSFVAPFRSDSRQQFAIEMKLGHIGRVVQEMAAVADALELDPPLRNLALAAAWLHDIGRFPQAVNHNTISDLKSVDHATLGVKIIEEEGVLDGIDPEERSILITAVANHNRIAPEEGLDGNVRLITLLLRDADKLDIIRVILKTDEEGSESEKETALFEMPETEGCSDAVLEALDAARLVRIADLRNRNDYRLLVLAWVYDLSFAPTFLAVKQRGYIDRLVRRLPKTPRVAQVRERLVQYLEAHLA